MLAPRAFVRVTAILPKCTPSFRIFPKTLPQIAAQQIRHLSTPSPSPASIPNQTPDHSEDYFNYTYGRFLWNETQSLRDRHREFNVDELKKIAAKAAGAQSCVSMKKVWETHYFKLFDLVMDDGSEVEVRVPHPIAGVETYTIASEVATMDFASSVMGVPVPKVLAWCAKENAVGAEYVVTEKVKGTKLVYLWDKMSLYEREKIIDELVDLEKKFLSVSFSKSGALYYADQDLPGCEEVNITGDFSEDTRVSLPRFVIGPTTEREFSEKGKSDMGLSRGPWHTAQDYYESIAHTEIAWLRRFAAPENLDMTNRWSVGYNQRFPEAHIEMLRKYLRVTPLIAPKEPDFLSFRLRNTELHDQNVLVHEGKITNIFDWQAISVKPLFASAEVPRCLRHTGDSMLELPENFKELDDEEKGKIRDKIARSIQSRLYSQKTEARNPLLHKALTYPHRDRITDLMCFAVGTWSGELCRLREILKRLERDWESLGIAAPCPYQFSATELKKHKDQAESFNGCQYVWQALSEDFGLSSDGWILHELFETAVAMFTEIRKHARKDSEEDPECTEEDREDLEKSMRWLLDHEKKEQAREGPNSV
ncbi:phosphotransferase enzyme family protein [Lophium mytilinum]|uniref:Phosphotransferase enzyme family protein n=1 Tax=Lophium mytilinum TaxID=390894 RepID=A0A6A6QI36_9PEZI|nr:phosphotransferase enzyme family protein [Lophium mytilinum]